MAILLLLRTYILSCFEFNQLSSALRRECLKTDFWFILSDEKQQSFEGMKSYEWYDNADIVAGAKVALIWM